MVNSIIKCPQCGGEKVASTGSNQYECQYCGAKFRHENESAPQQPEVKVSLCPYCGGEIPVGAAKCRHCGEWLNRPSQPTPQPLMSHPAYSRPAYQVKNDATKSKVVAAVLAIFLGGFGVHEFYLGKTGAGFAFLIITCLLGWLVFPLFIVGGICIIQAISYLCMSDQQFNEKYN